MFTGQPVKASAHETKPAPDTNMTPGENPGKGYPDNGMIDMTADQLKKLRPRALRPAGRETIIIPGGQSAASLFRWKDDLKPCTGPLELERAGRRSFAGIVPSELTALLIAAGLRRPSVHALLWRNQCRVAAFALACPRKKRIISRLASGPRASV